MPDFSALDLFQVTAFAIYAMLALISVVAVMVGLFKAIQFWRLGVGRWAKAETILDDWLSGRPQEAVKAAASHGSVLTRTLQAVFSGLQAQPNNKTYAEELGRQTANIELAALMSRMRSLEMVVQSAPMLGLLGTVVGMIDAFSAIAVSEGSVDPTQLASGIYTALTTTAVGLTVALIAFFIANWLEGRIDRERQMLETLISAAIYGRVSPTKRS